MFYSLINKKNWSVVGRQQFRGQGIFPPCLSPPPGIYTAYVSPSWGICPFFKINNARRRGAERSWQDGHSWNWLRHYTITMLLKPCTVPGSPPTYNGALTSALVSWLSLICSRVSPSTVSFTDEPSFNTLIVCHFPSKRSNESEGIYSTSIGPSPFSARKII